MRNQGLAFRWLLASSLLLAFCSQGPSPTKPSAVSAAVASVDEGRVGASAEGDVKVGTGSLEIERLRMDRQAGGVSVHRQYANPGQTYRATRARRRGQRQPRFTVRALTNILAGHVAHHTAILQQRNL